LADTTTALGKPELLRIADSVAQEKGIPVDAVIRAMEQAIQTAARRKYGHEHEIVAEIDRRSGEVRLYRVLQVVEEVEDPDRQIGLDEAHRRNPLAQVGDRILDPLPPIDLGRIAAQSAKQVIVQRVREAERERIYAEYKDRVGEIVVGEVKRVERGGILVDLGRAEAYLRREDMIPRESFRPKDRVRAYIYDVRKDARGPMILLSRTHPGFLVKLFEQEVPEIYEGIIEIKAVARDPGSRAKMAVYSHDGSIDPVGACVGMRGSRVQAVVQELRGEKIDIIPWSQDPATFVVNALAPAEVTKVVLDPDAHRIEVVVPDEQLHIAIGRRGQNVRLAAQLTGWEIDLVSESEEAERRTRTFQEATRLFKQELDVDEMIAQLLAAEGFLTVEDVAYAEVDELAAIQGFDEEVARALKERALEWLERRDARLREEAETLGVDADLLAFEELDLPSIVELARKGVKTLEDLAGLAADELQELLPELELSAEEAGEIVMRARIQLGWIAPEVKPAAGEADRTEEAAGER